MAVKTERERKKRKRERDLVVTTNNVITYTIIQISQYHPGL